MPNILTKIQNKIKAVEQSIPPYGIQQFMLTALL